MHRTRLIAAVLMGAAAAAAPLGAQGGDQDALARQVVNTADISPGDAVGVFGGEHTIDLMEAIAMEVAKRGGRPIMLLNTDRYEKAFWSEVPEEHITQRPPMFDLLMELDVYIGMPGVEDPGIFDAVPEERFALMQDMNAQLLGQLNRSNLRAVFVGYPNQAEAERARLDYDRYQEMHWAALATDYGKVSAHANRIAEMLQGAERVHVTTPAGTDLTFAVGDRPVFRDDGRITADELASDLVIQRVASLPGGEVFVAPQETSAEGRVVVPRDLCRNTLIRDAEFRFEAGELEDFDAAEGADCFEAQMAPYSGPKYRLGAFGIGLNPARHVVEEDGAEYRPSDAAGMVWIGIGNNEWIGGENAKTGEFGFPLTDATVEIDGVVVVRDGELVPGGN
jgi:aminopeptidase